MKEQSKKYYYNLQLEEVERIKASGKRPALLKYLILLFFITTITFIRKANMKKDIRS